MSMHILLDWMLVEGSYLKFRGKNNNGERKMPFITTISKKVREETLSKDRDDKQVEQKMTHLQEKCQEAHNWATGETGAGVWLANEGSWRDSVLKKCK